MNRIDSTRAIEKIWNVECKNGQLLYWNYNEECWSIKDDLKLLTKYKRAFEILKKKLGMIVRETSNYDKEFYEKDYEVLVLTYQKFLAKEEYELLEELMKGE